jgi:thiopurine S-methyltransferase
MEAEVEHDFWAKRWREGQIGFHEGEPNELLASHIARLETTRPLRILVPLAGKAFDLRWLADRGHEVVGVEFVPEAVVAFFAEQGLEPATSELGGMPATSGGGVTLVRGDMFDVGPEALGRFDLVYDRAAHVALEPSTRARYVELCQAMLADDGVIFLIAFAYDQAKAPGPPWSVDSATVRALYTNRSVEIVATRTLPASARLASAGSPGLEESAYLITALRACM